MSTLEELVFQALGEASMCWSEMPKGVFDSDHAKEVGEKLLMAIVEKDYQERKARIDAMPEEERIEKADVPTANSQRRQRGMKEMPNPTPEQLHDPLFTAIWEVIKSWDIDVPEYYAGYCGANGSHVMLLYNALKQPGI